MGVLRTAQETIWKQKTPGGALRKLIIKITVIPEGCYRESPP